MDFFFLLFLLSVFFSSFFLSNLFSFSIHWFVSFILFSLYLCCYQFVQVHPCFCRFWPDGNVHDPVWHRECWLIQLSFVLSLFCFFLVFLFFPFFVCLSVFLSLFLGSFFLC
jgi:hypothetical protein